MQTLYEMIKFLCQENMTKLVNFDIEKKWLANIQRLNSHIYIQNAVHLLVS